jgi:hypothetical protein
MKHFVCNSDFNDSGDAENGPGKLEPMSSFVFDSETSFDAEYFVKNIFFNGVDKMFEIEEISEEDFQERKHQDDIYNQALISGEIK